MAIDIFDLTNDSDFDESPGKTVNGALARFSPKRAKSAVNGRGYIRDGEEALRLQNDLSRINGVNAQKSDDVAQGIEEDAEFEERVAKRRKMRSSDDELGNGQPEFEHAKVVDNLQQEVAVRTVEYWDHTEQHKCPLDRNNLNMSNGHSNHVIHTKVSHTQLTKDPVHSGSESLGTPVIQESEHPSPTCEEESLLQRLPSNIIDQETNAEKPKTIEGNRKLKNGVNRASDNFRMASLLSSPMRSAPGTMRTTPSEEEDTIKAPGPANDQKSMLSLVRRSQPIAVDSDEDRRLQPISVDSEGKYNVILPGRRVLNYNQHETQNDGHTNHTSPMQILKNGKQTQSPVKAPETITVSEPHALPPVRSSAVTLSRRDRLAYTAEDNLLLARLKEVANLSWDDIMAHFPGRSRGSLQTHFCTKVKGKYLVTSQTHDIHNTPHRERRQAQANTSVAKSAEATRNVTVHQANESEVSTPTESRSSLTGRPSDHSNPSECSVHTAYGTQSSAPPEGGRKEPSILMVTSQSETSTSKHGEEYTPEDDVLLLRLKEIEKLSWNEIATHFPARTSGSLRFRYYNKVKSKGSAVAPASNRWQDAARAPTQRVLNGAPVNHSGTNQRARRRKREAGISAIDGFISWTDVNKRRLIEEHSLEAAEEGTPEVKAAHAKPLAQQDRTYPSVISRMLRQRELGSTCGRGWAGPARGISNDLMNHALSAYHLRKHFERMGGDVTCMAWSPEGTQFAAGSIPVSDDRSMQYNNQLNLLVGDSTDGNLFEQPEHHVPRPLIDDDDNINSLRSMRETQDSRLFKTVTAVAFSPNGKRLYTAGSDAMVRMYRVRSDERKTKCVYEIKHPASVDLLSVNNLGLLATACHLSSKNCVQVFDCAQKKFNLRLSLSPQRTDAESALPIFPSALRWGVAHHHSNFLLAGFTGDSVEEETGFGGETALWNVETGQRVALNTVSRIVFDVAWNPIPSSASTAFAVASTTGAGKSYKVKPSIVQCYAPGQNMARQVLEWECPATDINDVMYCPHDSNLIAAGATDGKVYLWDKRFADRNQKPLHTLAHGDSVNVLDPDRDREQTDTGIRFLSWGATGSRLYSGSSDGVVKVWNPYRASDNASVKDVATFHSSVMSGAFSSDYRDLLIGEESGRINLFSIGYDDEDGASKPSSSFKLHRAPAPPQASLSGFPSAQELLESGQIELKPMGDLPMRQAVQGHNYNGPYLKPSISERNQAQEVLDRALHRQNEAKSALEPIQLEGTNEEIAKAESALGDSEQRVHSAQDALEHLSRRYNDALELESAAIRNQLHLHEMQRKRAELEATHPTEPCDLDCDYLPKEVEYDSGRSEQRVPSAIQALPRFPVDLSSMDCRALFESGFSGKCMYCSMKVSNPIQAVQLKHLCLARLVNIKSKFTMACEYCKTPIRQISGNDSPHLCEGCNFACFRCTRTLRVVSSHSEGGQSLYCSHCGVSWIPGVLGYEIVKNGTSRERVEQGVNDNHIENLGREDTELMYYHSKWQYD